MQDTTAEPEIEEEEAPVTAPEPVASPVRLSEDEAAWMGESVDDSAQKPTNDVVEIEPEPAADGGAATPEPDAAVVAPEGSDQ